MLVNIEPTPYLMGLIRALAEQYDAPVEVLFVGTNISQPWNLSLEGITSFTVAPLKLATYLGLLTAFGAVVYAVQVVVKTLILGNEVPGYPSLMVVVLFLGGVQLMTLGIIGEYLARVFNETKHRPLEDAQPIPAQTEATTDGETTKQGKIRQSTALRAQT